jgi:hypothetical protein
MLILRFDVRSGNGFTKAETCSHHTFIKQAVFTERPLI